jgi:hypothetical protein
MFKKTQELKKSRQEFSKWLLIQETALIWITTLVFLILAAVSIKNGYIGELPWLTAMAAFPWTAYGVSQAFYYKKSMAENTKDGIKYDTTMMELNVDNKFSRELFDDDYSDGSADPEEEIPVVEVFDENAKG